jgi:hypothetical protein
MKSFRACSSCATAMLIAVFAESCSTESQIKHYSGDGKIEARPYYGFLHGGGGYDLKFEPIKLDNPAHFVYHFAGLPHRLVYTYFSIEDSRCWENRREFESNLLPDSYAQTRDITVACIDDLKGDLAMSLKDVKGNIIFQFDKRLNKLVWSIGGKGPWDLYDEKTSRFVPDSQEYDLELSINPDPVLKNVFGYVHIYGVGSEPFP